MVGAGSAGCVLANRLSVDGMTRVLLLEAGGRDSAPAVHTPALFGTLFNTEMDWAYRTVPQSGTGARVWIPRGRMLGGSSSMNAMVYIRGNRGDYDSWAADHGATGWGYDEVLPYFIRAECNSRLQGPLHGVDGPLHVQDPVYVHDLNLRWLDSATAWGLPKNDDFNGFHQIGVGPFQLTQSPWPAVVGGRCLPASGVRAYESHPPYSRAGSPDPPRGRARSRCGLRPRWCRAHGSS